MTLRGRPSTKPAQSIEINVEAQLKLKDYVLLVMAALLCSLLQGSKDFTGNMLRPSTICSAAPLAEHRNWCSSCSCDTSEENNRKNSCAVKIMRNCGSNWLSTRLTVVSWLCAEIKLKTLQVLLNNVADFSTTWPQETFHFK